jgi:hypothetical protein
VCWSIVVKEKPSAGSPFYRAIPSDSLPKAMKDVSVHFCINSSNSCKLYERSAVKYNSEFREHLEATTYSRCYIFPRFRS